jgi:all-trans-retinol 13,14-reductase
LARCGQRVLVLEQHTVAGGLTQTFKRHDWSFATGVHYVSGVGPAPGPAGQFGRMLHWLTGGALQFASCGNPYDIVRLPGFELGIEHPQAAFRKALGVRFPAQQAAIEAWFEQLDAASQSARSLLVMRGLPAWLAWGWRLWHGAEVRRSQQTLAEALRRRRSATACRALGTRWATGSAPGPRRCSGTPGAGLHAVPTPGGRRALRNETGDREAGSQCAGRRSQADVLTHGRASAARSTARQAAGQGTRGRPWG